MDLRIDCSGGAARWSGVLRLSRRSPECIHAIALAHGQNVEVAFSKGVTFDDEMTCTVYGAKVLDCGSSPSLVVDEETAVIPHGDELAFHEMKEAFGGIGCIGLAGQFAGIQRIASLDHNSMTCRIQEANGAHGVICGDVLKIADRQKLHCTPYPSRCLMAGGFPCQPLSTQGDQRGDQDPRAAPFYGLLHAFWEQQGAALLLECVPGAMEATYIQKAVQKLAFAMGMNIRQQILSLDRAWPCRRRRWWCLLLPVRYPLSELPDLPWDGHFQSIDALITLWPTWDQASEEELLVQPEEQLLLNNPNLGTDVRHLQVSEKCPCILHSYGNFAMPCPCGCRSAGFTFERLLRGGLRGFYVTTSEGNHRYLHPAEAALLNTIPPDFEWPVSARAALSMIGQCAAPLQALWVIGHMQERLQWMPNGNALQLHLRFKAHLVRAQYGVWNVKDGQLVCLEDQAGVIMYLRTDGKSTIQNFVDAENKITRSQGPIVLSDEFGPLPNNHRLRSQTLTGPYQILRWSKRQPRILKGFLVPYTLSQQGEQLASGTIHEGAFIFEVFRAHGFNGWIDGLRDRHSHRLCLDDQIFQPLHIVEFMAHGSNHSQLGLTDRCIDRVAAHLHSNHYTGPAYWLPAGISNLLLHHCNYALIQVWRAAVLIGTLRTALVINGHWILLELKIMDGSLVVSIWDGLYFEVYSEVSNLAKRWTKDLGLRSWAVSANRYFTQGTGHGCGTVLLQHLGWRLGIWNHEDALNEASWHAELLRTSPSGGFFVGHGRPMSHTSEEQDLLWRLRDVLEQHGVAPDHTEERATLALQKIGLRPLQEAMGAKNAWSALKALGSQPKHNYLWVKPAELDQQIRRRAEAKFKVDVSRKKTKQTRAEKTPVDIDPHNLALIPNTFTTDEDDEVAQLAMEEVGSQRIGLAFGRVQDILPFLREGKPLSTEALGVLTTQPVPNEDQGLLPVVDMRYPALYVPTGEPVLIQGSLVQLGDATIVRAQEKESFDPQPIPTLTLKVSVFQDEWQSDWSVFVQTPIKEIMRLFPQFTLCKGFKCGETCLKVHSPVDIELDNVVTDLWGRTWQSYKGNRVPPGEATLFQVLMRVPEFVFKTLQSLSGRGGLYVEPRQEDGRGPSPSTVVLWLPSGTLADAQHKCRTLLGWPACLLSIYYNIQQLNIYR